MKVIVIGSGLAGLTSAYISYMKGDQVTILEKTGKIGGNSIKASSGINFIGENDTEEQFYKDTISSGKYNNHDVAHTLIRNSENAKRFLKHCGLSFDKVFLGGGHSKPRTHSIKNKQIGNCIINCIYDKIKSTDIEIKTDCCVSDLDIRNVKVYGVICNSEYINCDKVILATGGYGCNDQLLGKYTGFPTTNNITTTGDGVIMCIKNNLRVRNLDDVQIHPTSFIDPSDKNNKFKYLAPEAFRGLGGVLIDRDGKRFVNELDTRDKVSEAVISKKYVFLVVDENILSSFGNISEFYVKKKLLEKFETIEKISKRYSSMDTKNISTSLNSLTRPYYIANITPAIHYTMGGVEINASSQVLSNISMPIEGLYACGEVTTGVHGKNRLVGNSLLECVVFGIIAGNGGYIRN